MADVNWDQRAKQGVGLQSVIDPGDRTGLKNDLIDRIQWARVGPWAATRRSILDFGCGIGRFAPRIGALGAAYVGVDTSAEMIAAAQRVHAGRASEFVHAPGLPLPFESGRFDGCLTVGVLQCLKSADGVALRAATTELARVLAPGGELLMIEQASASGGYSGSVSESAHEDDYRRALDGLFDIVDVRRIRSSAPSRLTVAYQRWGASLPARGWFGDLLARRESAAIGRAGPERLRSLVYYDVAIQAVRRSAA